MAMRAVAGICAVGMISVMLQKKTKKKMDTRKGVHPSPSRPIVCITMSLSMNSTDTSATLRTPVGAFIGSLRFASTKMTTVASTEKHADQGDLVERREDVRPHEEMADLREVQGEHAHVEVLTSMSRERPGA